jgi:K+-sensing histidine kinase KdpD
VRDTHSVFITPFVSTAESFNKANGFYVEDYGVGTSDGDHKAVFEKECSKGEAETGLGLSIMTLVAEAHGWTITATESQAGGARFEVRGVDVAE